MDARPAPVVEIGVLGEIRVLVAGVPVAVGGARQRALLARLAVDHGTAVSTDRLIDALWDGSPPRTAPQTLRTHVARLRRALEVSGVTDGHVVVATVPNGYRLTQRGARLDAQRFERAVQSARRTLEDGDPREAVAVLERTLHVWRGSAYGAFAERLWAQPEALRLDELHTTAEELQVSALLRTGGVADATARARSLVCAHPLRESAVDLLARAYCRSGRQADAIAVIDGYSGRLAAAAALRPSARLQRLVASVRRGDLSRAGPRPARPTPDPQREDVAVAVGSAVREWLDGHVRAARATAVGATALDADTRHRLRRCLGLLAPTDGLARLLATECARVWARSPDLAERCLVSLDAYALSRHPDGLNTARRELDQAGLDRSRALRMCAFATMHAPLGAGFAQVVDALWSQPDPVLQVEAHRMQVVLQARRGAMHELPDLLDAYEAAAVRWGVDAARDFARTSRMVLRLAEVDQPQGAVVSGIASSTIKNAVLDLATLWQQLRLGDVGPTTRMRVRALRHAGLTPSARDALLGYAAALVGDRATAAAMQDRLVGGLADLPYDPFQVLTIVAVLHTAEVLGDTDVRAVAGDVLARERLGETLGVWPLDLVIGDAQDVVAGARGSVSRSRADLPSTASRGGVV